MKIDCFDSIAAVLEQLVPPLTSGPLESNAEAPESDSRTKATMPLGSANVGADLVPSIEREVSYGVNLEDPGLIQYVEHFHYLRLNFTD